MSIKQLIEAIEQGDASTIAALFDKVMAGKLAEAIESRKKEVAEELFLEQVSDDEQSIEDFTTEEIEAFMQTEEFEQLDELSKSTLGSYIKKANGNATHHGVELGRKKPNRTK